MKMKVQKQQRETIKTKNEIWKQFSCPKANRNNPNLYSRLTWMTILFKKRMTCWIYPSKNKQLIEHQRLLTTKSLGWDHLCTRVLICPQNMASVHRGVRNTPIHSRGCSSTSPRRNNSCRVAPYWMATYPCFSHLTSTTSTTPHSMVKAPISPALAITNIGS